MKMNTQEKIAVMQAFEAGETIQIIDNGFDEPRWVDVDRPSWNWEICTYRVKPEKTITRDQLITDIVSHIDGCNDEEIAAAHREVCDSSVYWNIGGFYEKE